MTLNRREKKLVKELIKNPDSKPTAYQKAYPKSSKESAKTLVHKKLRDKPEILLIVQQALDSNEKASIDNLIRETVKDINGKKEVLHNGKVIELKDNSIRDKAIDRLLRLHGTENKSPSGDVNAGSINQFNISLGSKEEMERMAELLRELNTPREDDGRQTGEIIDIDGNVE